jgi:hypothetical protein
LIKSAQTSYPFDKAWVVEKLQVWVGEFTEVESPWRNLYLKMYKWQQEHSEFFGGVLGDYQNFPLLALKQELGIELDDPLWEDLEEASESIIAQPLLLQASSDWQLVKELISKLMETPESERTLELFLEIETEFGQVLDIKKLYKAPKDPLLKSAPVKLLQLRNQLQPHFNAFAKDNPTTPSRK